MEHICYQWDFKILIALHFESTQINKNIHVLWAVQICRKCFAVNMMFYPTCDDRASDGKIQFAVISQQIFMVAKDRRLGGRLEPPSSSPVLLRAAWWLGCISHQHCNGQFTDVVWLLRCCCAHFNSVFSEESSVHKLNQFCVWNKYLELWVCAHYGMKKMIPLH